MCGGGEVVDIDGDSSHAHLLATWAKPDKDPYVVPHISNCVPAHQLFLWSESTT
jgi:hypothetical protein